MKRSLRHSDFFAKYSPSQYVILLQGGNQRGCELVYKRISERFSEEKKGWAKNLKYSALPAKTEKELEFLEARRCFMIRVQLLGRFRMYDETRCLNEEAIHSPMITKLLVYMVCNKNHIVTLEQLTEALWTDEESENPYGALKKYDVPSARNAAEGMAG